MEKFMSNLLKLQFLDGYRTYLAVAASVMGGLTLIIQGISVPDGPNWSQIGVGAGIIGNALGFSGVVGKIEKSNGAGTHAGKVATGDA